MEILPNLGGPERADLLRMGKVVAERSSKLAVTFLRAAPRAASSIHPTFRPLWIRWGIGLAEHSRETLIDFLEKSPEILGALPEGEILFFLHYGLKLAARDPSVSYKYFMNLPRIQKEIQKDQFPSMVRGWTFPDRQKPLRGPGLLRAGVKTVSGPGPGEWLLRLSGGDLSSFKALRPGAHRTKPGFKVPSGA